MIRIFADRREGRYRFFAEGHADASADRDVVCAGVSSLVQALVCFANENPECRHLRYSVEPGRVFLSCRGGLGNAFDVILSGISGIAENYPNQVKFFGRLTTKPENRDIISATVKHPSDAAKV